LGRDYRVLTVKRNCGRNSQRFEYRRKRDREERLACGFNAERGIRRRVPNDLDGGKDHSLGVGGRNPKGRRSLGRSELFAACMRARVRLGRDSDEELDQCRRRVLGLPKAVERELFDRWVLASTFNKKPPATSLTASEFKRPPTVSVQRRERKTQRKEEKRQAPLMKLHGFVDEPLYIHEWFRILAGGMDWRLDIDPRGRNSKWFGHSKRGWVCALEIFTGPESARPAPVRGFRPVGWKPPVIPKLKLPAFNGEIEGLRGWQPICVIYHGQVDGPLTNVVKIANRDVRFLRSAMEMPLGLAIMGDADKTDLDRLIGSFRRQLEGGAKTWKAKRDAH